MFLIMYIIGVIIIIIGLILGFREGDVAFFGITTLSSTMFAFVFFALGKILLNQETLIQLARSSQHTVTKRHVDQVECKRCRAKYDYDRASCPKCGETSIQQ